MSEALHSQRGYLQVLLFMLGLALFHYVTLLAFGSFPKIVVHLSNPSLNPLPYAEDYYERILIRYLALRYSVYPLLLFVFFFDHVKRGARKFIGWLSPKDIAICSLSIGAFFLSPRLHVFTMLIWVFFFASCFYYLRQVFPVSQSLWLTGLFFFSCEEVWEYGIYLSQMVVVTAPIVSMYVWRATPTFLLIMYLRKFRVKLTKPFLALLLLALIISMLAYLPLLKVLLPGDHSTVLKTVWAVSYVFLARNLAIGRK